MFARIAEWLVPDKKVEEKVIIEPKYLNDDLLEYPAMALEAARFEISRLGEIVSEMMAALDPAFKNRDLEKFKAVRAMDAWATLHDWLRLPDRVRTTVPLALQCRGTDGPCGYHRLVLPRLGELPEDLTRPTGKTLEPTDWDAFLDYATKSIPIWYVASAPM